MEKTKQDFIRPPVVTIMGHVDHGKTTLLDAIRKTNVVAAEHGGITQHIGAYQVTHHGKTITFIDTPGHAAFEQMRSRGAKVADIVVLVVAANDGVKPQTVEAIKHIKKTSCKVIVAITKVDLPNTSVEKVKSQLKGQDVAVEGYGGDIPVVEVAAPKNKGIAELLEVINLVWDLSPAPSLPNDPLEAVVVESFLAKNRGPVTTVIVIIGTLKVGQKIMVDQDSISVRALVDNTGKNIKEAGPGKPVEILGFKKVMEVGGIVTARTVTKNGETRAPATMAEIIAKSEGAKSKFKVIIKADVAGSLEAVLANLPQKAQVISSGTGEITDNDIAFAKTANAPIIAFNIKVPPQTRVNAQREGIYIKSYDVIYKLLEDLEEVVAGFEQAKQETKIVGRAKIVATFTIEGARIAGAKVTYGKLTVGDQIVIRRGQKELGSAKILSLKRFKKNYQEIPAGQDCGIGMEPILDFTEQDIIESFGS
ncbi:MAG: translation initiation factor IF-2 [Patescibacteria group bacterium]